MKFSIYYRSQLSIILMLNSEKSLNVFISKHFNKKKLFDRLYLIKIYDVEKKIECISMH